jgi:hypothetical protein
LYKEDIDQGSYCDRHYWQNQAQKARADEREACAKVCDELHWPWHMGDNSGPKECAAAIRARSGDQHTAIKQALAAPVQEPVAWMDKYGEICKEVGEVLSTDTPLYKKDNL